MTAEAGTRGPAAREAARIREDVHVHAGAAAIHRRLLALHSYDQWLAPAFRDYRADDEGCAFTLALPLRAERARLRRDGIEEGAVVFVRDGGGVFESITWALHAEGPRELHVTVEAAYHPAGGPLGAFLETLLHRPHRAQALRDSLWRLKQLIETEATPAARG